MRVLWLSPTPSLYDEKKYGGWIASLEDAIRQYGQDIELGIAFQYSKNNEKKTAGSVTYFPINRKENSILNKIDYTYHWKNIKSCYLNIIDCFKPDIIQCFGSEWEYGLLAQEVEIPFIIHMQGFINIQNYCTEVVNRGMYNWISKVNLISQIKKIRGEYKNSYHNEIEKEIMRTNHFFLGRTDWDASLVKYYSLNAKYFYCSEVLRPQIYNSDNVYSIKKRKKCKLLTITQGSPVKGNEILLQTARLLKKEFNFDFEWRVAGRISEIKKYEKLVGTSFEKNNVVLLGMIPVEDVIKEIVECDIFVNTSINDNSPNSVCESQLLGCPVVSSNVGGISSIVQDNKTGLLYPYNEPHTLAFKIMDLFQNKKKMKELSKNERELALIRHNPQNIVKDLYNIYLNILNQ